MNELPLPQENPLFNLLTNFEATVDAMAQIEGTGWKSQQGSKKPYSTASAVEYLMSDGAKRDREELAAISDEHERRARAGAMYSVTIYGDGGDNRWQVYVDGRIIFDGYYCHRTSVREKVKALGFEMREG